TGTRWTELAARYNVSAAAFHVPLPPGEPGGVLARAYTEFRSRPVGDWGAMDLGDTDVIALVNLRMMTRVLRRSSAEVLEAMGRFDSYADVYDHLVRSAR
ncbi:MAG: hypothetical protein OEZ37_06000, partial [Gemmatimonadota bacterium]|nr:hypothetical protein [Gemmatimonadota bacterium]